MKPHITIDAGISTFNLMKLFIEKNAMATMGCNQAHSNFWRLLKFYVDVDRWTAAVHKDGFIMSLKCQRAESTDNNRYGLQTGSFEQVKYNNLVTNAFKMHPVKTISTTQEDQSQSIYSDEDLTKKKVSELRDILK